MRRGKTFQQFDMGRAPLLRGNPLATLVLDLSWSATIKCRRLLSRVRLWMN